MNDLHPALFLGLLAVGFVIAARVVRVTSWFALQKLAERTRAGKSTHWNVRLPRVGAHDGRLEALRREKRIRATAVLIARIANTVLFVVSVLIALAALEVDVVWFVGSVGFLGVGLAIGAQHSVNDFIAGLHVLLEDRFFEGDRIEIGEVPEQRITGTVERIGMFATRLRHEGQIIHVANRTLTHVRNHSQTWHAVRLDLAVSPGVPEATVIQAVHEALDAVTTVPRAGGIVDRVATVNGTDARVEVDARLSQGLTAEEHVALTDEVLRRLEFED